MQELLDASACRLLAVFIIDGIEMMLHQWRARDHQQILDVYFKGRHPNGERVRALCDAFQHAGITVDPQVFLDYLAIRYLRNTIVHGLSSAGSPPIPVDKKMSFGVGLRRISKGSFPARD